MSTTTDTSLTEEQAAALIEEYGLAVSKKDRMHVMSLGKAMTDQTYQTFATLRDDTIPALRNRLLAAILAARPAVDRALRADAAVRIRSAVVEVCPDCDIAGCRHIRGRAAEDAANKGGAA